ncbi:MAG: hypothetical protein ABWZ99_09505, partial [Ilumatobacteraceae bacterium]
IAEQDTSMVATMRRDWDETGALPILAAHRRHRQIADDSNFSGVGSDTLNEHMGAVVERAHRQGAPASSPDHRQHHLRDDLTLAQR